MLRDSSCNNNNNNNLQPLPECNDDVLVDEAVDHVTVERQCSHLYFKE